MFRQLDDWTTSNSFSFSDLYFQFLMALDLSQKLRGFFFWRGNVKFYFPLCQAPQIGMWESDFGKNSHPLPASASYPRIPVLGSGLSDPILVSRHYRRGKITFLPPWMVRVWLRSLFSRTPHKSIGLSLIHCEHYKARLSLVSLACLLSLKTTLFTRGFTLDGPSPA